MHSRNSLKIGAWNIDGLHSRIGGIRTSKLTFAPVINSLQNVDIFCLSETHCESSDVINVEGYHVVQRFRPQSLRAPHAFGGLAVGIKINLLKGVKFLPSKTSEFMWFKLCKSFFGIKRDLYVCSLYVSPSSSSYSQRSEDIFSLIEQDIAKFSLLGNCMLLGDFNARTSLEPNYIVNDSLNVHSDYVLDTPLDRRNSDSKPPDAHGKLLLELCKGGGL